VPAVSGCRQHSCTSEGINTAGIFSFPLTCRQRYGRILNFLPARNAALQPIFRVNDRQLSGSHSITGRSVKNANSKKKQKFTAPKALFYKKLPYICKRFTAFEKRIIIYILNPLQNDSSETTYSPSREPASPASATV
jgi:hypothetical protein